MTEFEAQGVLEITDIGGNSVTNIERGLDGIGVNVSQSGGAGVTQTGAGNSALDTLKEQSGILDDIRDAVEKGAVSGGGGGGGNLLGSVTGGGLGLTDLLGVTSFASLVRGVSLTSLITKIPAFGALIGGGILASEFVTGDLGSEDLVQTPVKVGTLVTGGLVGNDLIEGTIGAASIIGGTVQLTSLLTSSSVTAATLSSMLGSVSIGSILTGLAGGGAAAAGGVALAALLGTTAIGTIISDDSSIDPANHLTKMEFEEALVDAGRANIEVVDFITPAPLDAFIAEKTDPSKDEGTVSTGSDLDPTKKNKVSASKVNGNRGPQATGEALEREGLRDIGTPQDDVEPRDRFTRNRARERQNRQQLDVNFNGNLTLEQTRSAGLLPDGEIPPEVRRRILNLVERELLGGGF